jgi:hypothetical protein
MAIKAPAISGNIANAALHLDDFGRSPDPLVSMTPRGRGWPGARNQTRVSIAARAARCGQGHTRRYPSRRPAGSSNALLRRCPLRTQRATFTALRSSTALSVVPTPTMLTKHGLRIRLIVDSPYCRGKRRRTGVIPVSSRLPLIESQTMAYDSCTMRKWAPFQVRANLEPLCGPLQAAVRFFRNPMPAPPTAFLADCLPSYWFTGMKARNRVYHVPILADPRRWAYPVSTCLFPDGASTTYFHTLRK